MGDDSSNELSQHADQKQTAWLGGRTRCGRAAAECRAIGVLVGVSTGKETVLGRGNSRVSNNMEGKSSNPRATFTQKLG